MPSLIIPPLLKPGHTIGLCSPAGPSPAPAIERGIHALEARSYHVVVADHATDSDTQTDYLAGTDTHRVADLHQLFADPTINLILCLRGGYGTMRLLDTLDYDLIARNPKPLVGYSDITALSLALAHRANLVSFSGPMVTGGDGFGESTFDPFTETSFFRAVGAGASPRLLTDDPTVNTWEVHRAESAGCSGRLFPVCLTLLVSLLGTPFLPDLTGAILVIEDVHEPPYKVDRALTQLRLAGILERLTAVLIGSFNGATEAENDALLTEVPRLVCAMTPPHVTVVSGIAYGHIPRRLTLPVGAEVSVDFAGQTFLW